MFIGIDHGTTGIRFAGIETENRGDATRIFELSREEAASMDADTIMDIVETGLETRAESIELIALTYSMGDGFSRIKKIGEVNNRGLSGEGGAGKRVGGGTNVFDAIKDSGIPAIMIPGIHARSESIDPRMRFFSHCASPEKVGVAYHIYKQGFENFIFSDVSSNTVTMCVVNGVIIGGMDACIGAPGLYQGPIDLQLIRDIDSGKMSAGDAFANAGVTRKGAAADASATLALFVAMEVSAMRVLMHDYGVSADAIFLTGSEGEKRVLKERVDRLLDVKTRTLTRYSAAIGCAEIARDVHYGTSEIMGIKVEI